MTLKAQTGDKVSYKGDTWKVVKGRRESASTNTNLYYRLESREGSRVWARSDKFEVK